IGRAGQDPADGAFTQSLMDRAEQEVAAGHLGPALDLARAARRATGIIRREARVADALARADAVIAKATTAGIDTETFRRNVEQARAIASRGDHASAERLLKRVSLRSLDERRENALHTSLEKAEARIRYSKERGGTVGDAEAFLQEARKALGVREYGKIRTLTSKAVETAESQRRRARMEGFLDRASSEVDLARNEGIDIGEARKLLTQARDAVRRGVFGDIPLLAQRARNSLREGRVVAAAEAALREVRREASRELRSRARMSARLAAWSRRRGTPRKPRGTPTSGRSWRIRCKSSWRTPRGDSTPRSLASSSERSTTRSTMASRSTCRR